MKESNTAIRKLSAKYRSILKKCALLNAMVLVSVAVAAPAQADEPILNTPVFVGGDVIGGNGGEMGRRDMGDGTSTYPGYQIDVNSLTLVNGDVAYVGHSTTNIADTTGRIVKFNWQTTGDTAGVKDIDIADGLNIVVGDSSDTIDTKLSGFPNEMAKNYIKWYATTDNTKTPGTLSITGTTLTTDSATINVANSSTILNSTITVEKTPKSNSDGITTLNTPKLVAENTHFNIAEGATLKLNTTKATFSNSTNQQRGGAIYNAGTTTVNNSEFNKNTATQYGGAIFVASGTLNVNNSTFTENNGEIIGGAISDVYNVLNTLNINEGTSFTENYATTGGAIGAYNAFNINGTSDNKVTFKDNHTTAVDDGGGAIVLGAHARTTINNAVFENNYANLGGAIATRPEGVKGDNAVSEQDKDGHWLTISNSEFRNNRADATLVGGTNGSTYTYHGYDFINGDGGAIWNGFDGSTINGEKHENVITNSSFIGNIAANRGGAIFNKGTLNFTGTNIFSGNMANGELNDIYNVGTINISGDLTLDGGISGGETGKTIFANGSKLTVKANETKIANSVTNNGATLNLNLDNGFTGTYEMVIDGNLDNEFTIAENTLYNINTTDTKGTYDISKKSGAEVASETGATQNQAAAVTAITNGEGNNATFNAIAENISDLMQSGSAMGVQLALDAAETLAPEATPTVLQTTSENIGQVFSAVSARLSGGAATASNSQGMSSGDSVFENGAVWVQGLYNHAKLNDTRKAKGYKADSNGLAFGFEKQINDNVKAGIGYAYTKTDVDGHNRDLDIDTHTALVYGEYKPSAWFVNAMASYSWSDYDEDKRVLGQKITGDYDAQSYALQAMTGYEFAYDNTIFTPEAGLRYIHISQDGHKDTAGQYVYGSEVDTLTGIAGLRVEQAYALDNGWTLRPSARFAVTYDIANDDGNSAALLANGTAYSVKGEAMDRFGMEADFALTADISENASVSLGYQGKFRDDYKDHTGLLNLKYNF